MEEDSINRNPTEEEKIKALNEHTRKKSYEWSSRENNQSDWHIWGSSGKGENLWEAIIDDAEHSSSQHRSLDEQWADNQAGANIKDKDLREEYMPADLWGIYVKIGSKGREIGIGQVHAKNEKDALNPTREEVQKAGEEFIGLDYKVIAKKEEPDMTEEEFEKMCYDRAYEDTNDIENMIDDIKDDNCVADWFGIIFGITEWECDNPDCINTDEVIAICECGYPLSKLDMYDEKEERQMDCECPYCGIDTRTGEEKFVCNI